MDPAVRALAECGTLAEAIRVGLRLAPPVEVVDVIVQDEYTHDVIFAARPAQPGAGAIVVDCT